MSRMKSLLEAARKSGFTSLPVKISDVGQAVKLTRPFSLTKMCRRPAIMEYKDTVRNEELETSFTFTITSLGEWIFAGYVVDHSKVFGYSFDLQVSLNYVDENGGMAFTPRVTGDFGQIIFASDHRIEFMEQGRDPYIQNNWNRLSVQQFKYAFIRNTNAFQIIATILVVPALLLGIAAGAAVILGSVGIDNEHAFGIKQHNTQPPDVTYP